MANPTSLDAAGFDFLKNEEAVIEGLYDDPSGYCTYGVGHLVHKHTSFLLEAATADQKWQQYVKEKWPGTSNATPYLDRAAKSDKDFAAFVKATKTANAGETSKIQAEADVMSSDVIALFRQKVKQYESCVANTIKTSLTQNEFNALVSLCYNIGKDKKLGFPGSTAARLINEGKYKSGDAATRKIAIDAIDAAIKAWKKSGGQTSKGLIRRRQREADLFLQDARDQLKKLQQTTPSAAPGAFPRPGASPTMIASASGASQPRFTTSPLQPPGAPNSPYSPTFPTHQDGINKISV